MTAYTVIYLFDYSDPSRLLMVLKDRTFNRGKFNGVGGKVEHGEDYLQCAIREIKEETGAELSKDDLYYLGTRVVDDCTNKPGTQSNPEFFPADIPDTVRSAAAMLRCAGAEN